MGSPFPSPSLPSHLVSSLLGKQTSMSPSLYTTVLTDGSDKLSWPVMSVGGYCCRGEEKWGEGGWETYNRVSCLDKAAFSFFVKLVQLSKHSFVFILRTCMLHFCRNLEALGFCDPSQAHLCFVVFV